MQKLVSRRIVGAIRQSDGPEYQWVSPRARVHCNPSSRSDVNFKIKKIRNNAVIMLIALCPCQSYLHLVFHKWGEKGLLGQFESVMVVWPYHCRKILPWLNLWYFNSSSKILTDWITPTHWNLLVVHTLSYVGTHPSLQWLTNGLIFYQCNI